jgi:hypothetical protein
MKYTRINIKWWLVSTSFKIYLDTTLCERDTRQLWGTNLIHPLARDVKDTLLTRKRQLSADSDSNSLLGVLLFMINRVGNMCVAAMSLCMIVLIVTRKRGDGRYYFAYWTFCFIELWWLSVKMYWKISSQWLSWRIKYG